MSTPLQNSFNSASNQRERLLSYLREHGSITTIAARRDLDILMPAARFLELRRFSHRIDTVWVDRATEAGRVHRVAKYVLVGEAP